MEIRLDDLAASPALYPQKLDLIRDAVLLIRMGEADYREASFLDDRVLRPGIEGAWAPFEAVAQRSAGPSLPLHFIFHAGHVGSTLLSRVLDATGTVLGLREPLPLRTLAEAHDLLGKPEALLDGSGFAQRLDTLLSLWRRGFPSTETAVVKATSAAARLHATLLTALPEAKAVYLNLPAEPYLATLLAGENAWLDLRALGQERIRRLRPALADDTPRLHALSPGELAAASWLAERLCQQEAVAAFAARVLPVDFDEFLRDTDTIVARILDHFSIRAPARFADGVRALPAFSRYAKAPDQFAYSPELRQQILTQARAAHHSEIAKGLALLERLAARNSRVAAAL